VVGGGYIAVEFAGIFNGLGSQVTQLYRGPLFLRGFDQDIREAASREIAAAGVDLQFNSNVASIVKLPNGTLQATLEDGRVLEADTILYATGRKPHLQDLDFDKVNVEQNSDGTIKVDQHFKTSEDNIFAIGDITGGMELTPVALADGMAFAKTQFNNQPTTVDYSTVPTAVFCQPNIGTCGYTEAEAKDLFGDIVVFESSFRAMKHTIGGREEKTYMKMIVDRSSDRVVGIHMLGEDAGEIIQGMAIAMKAGATKAVFDSTIGIHPTSAEEFVTMRSPRD
jgi:glutathione reductase (NADPH)